MAKATVKLVVDKTANRVLFAEAGEDFLDFLFHIQELPVGLVSRLVRSASDNAPGSVQNITDSISNLQQDDPEVCNCGLKFKVSSTSESCCTQEKSLAVLTEPSDKTMKGRDTYLVTDNLVVKTMTSDSYFDLLKGFKVKRIGDVEEKDVDVARMSLQSCW